MSTDPPTPGDTTSSAGGSPVKRSAPSLEQLAARYHKDRPGAEETKQDVEKEEGEATSEPTPSLRRLGLAGRLGKAADPANAPAAWAKSSVIPSLNEIRARLNKRGVDVTSSKWSKKGSSPTKEGPPSPSKQHACVLSEEASRVETAPAEAAESIARTAPPDSGSQADIATSTDDQAQPEPEEARQDKTHEAPAAATPSAGTAPAAADKQDNVKPSGPTTSEDATSHASRYPPGSGQEAALAAKSGQKHPLQQACDQYESKLKCIGHFTTLESFFDTFATLHRPSQLGRNTNYHLFKAGIKPMWEDPANANGGRWILTLREQAHTAGGRAAHEALLDRSWMWLVFGLIGEHFDEHDQVTGAVCSLRAKGDRIALWLRNKEPVDAVNALGDKFLQLLELSNVPSVQLEFSTNDGSKGDYLSVRNTPKPKQDPVAPAQEPALNKWLDSELTLHPTDHAWYYAQQAQGKET
ncbi:hypothetical protein CBS9595_003167 [Malassezia furfur]|nr:hypothetical protein CBS9595_003167 [Malassezia furfur]